MLTLSFHHDQQRKARQERLDKREKLLGRDERALRVHKRANMASSAGGGEMEITLRLRHGDTVGAELMEEDLCLL